MDFQLADSGLLGRGGDGDSGPINNDPLAVEQLMIPNQRSMIYISLGGNCAVIPCTFGFHPFPFNANHLASHSFHELSQLKKLTGGCAPPGRRSWR